MDDSQKMAERALRVLVVDDNRDAANILARLVEEWGYECRVAYDGPSGLARACEYTPDCLITDIEMPGFDGYTLAQRIRQQPGLERTKLAALTALDGEEVEARAREAGFDHTLLKPSDPA